MAKFTIKDIKGVIPALMTAFDEHEEVYEKGIRELVDHLMNEGVEGFYLTGSTGEGFLMNEAERKQVVEIVIDEVKGRVPVIVHVGAISTKISIELAEHAEKMGADAISSVPPFYWRFSPDHIYNYYKDISESVDIPMIVYNVPLAGIMGFDLIKRLASIEKVEGIKFTATSHHEISMIKKEVGQDFMIYSGADEMAVSGLINGADGIIGSFYNLMPEMFIKINELVKKDNVTEAMAVQKDAIDLIMYSVQKDYYSVMKVALKWMGVDAGYVRRPFINIQGQEEEALKEGFKALKKAGNIKDVKFLDAL
ncbi:dihydrodipicolinate synthase family protein [Acidaminobacter sp. JC074]|uniref:dihydrodipicolinate synthase family protein n=1 Tax=Acidaminobacter sp. JC074 TaxID=2530199 RepID=UPI001F1163F8|nr:dihydrodipicolinate synthase family protein [Acidaminobacter sp. JC074]MCH4887515.1 dihydrodipicolinate synthase family protein [Acidaminobacter sp. JC074]